MPWSKPLPPSHQWPVAQAARELGKPLSELNMIACHIGNGASMTVRHTYRAAPPATLRDSRGRCPPIIPHRHLCGLIERIPGGTRKNDGLETVIGERGLRPRDLEWPPAPGSAVEFLSGPPSAFASISYPAL